IIELENVDPLPQSISSTTISLVFQTTESTLQQLTNLIALNSEFKSINDEFDEQSDDEFDEQLELYKGHVEKDASGVYEISRSFVCRYAGKLQNKDKSHKTERSGSCRTNCKWKVNIYWSKSFNEYHISTFTNIHTGHTLDATTIQFIPKNHKLTKEMLKDIEFYALSEKINASAQYQLLLEKYKVLIHRSNLYNAITKVKRMVSHGDNDAAEFCTISQYADRRSWARAYTFRHFTAGAQATSRVESINLHIKSIICHAHSLALFKQVEDKVVEVWEVIHITWQHSRLHVMVFSLAAKFSINFVAKRWLLEKYQDKDLGIQPLVNLSTVFLSELSEASAPMTILSSNESSSLFSASNEMSTMTRFSLSVIAKKAMQKKKIYAETIGIAQKAINIAIEKDDLNVLKFLKTYILQNDCSLVENTTNASASGYKTSILKEHSEPNVIIEKSSKAQDKQSKSHAKRVNKTCDSTIICEFCGGHSYKKELYDYDNVEKKENESK
ncbi:7951_t:CDS:2, partial [Dentiscutata erythropus]